MARVALDGYVSGILSVRDEAARTESEHGNDAEAAQILARNAGQIIVPAAVEKAIFEAAALDAQSWAHEIEERCRRVLTNIDHRPGYDHAEVRRQLGAAIRKDLEWKPEEFALARRRGRRMKIGNKEQHRRNQKTKLPHLRYMQTRVLPDVMRAARKAARDKTRSPEERKEANELAKRIEARLKKDKTNPRRVKPWVAEAHASVGWNRWFNRAVIQSGLKDEDVIFEQWTTKRDSKVCEICRPFGDPPWTVKKDSPELGTHSMPAHYKCRCRWMHVRKVDVEKEKIKATKIPEVEFAEGFGGLPMKGKEALPWKKEA